MFAFFLHKLIEICCIFSCICVATFVFPYTNSYCRSSKQISKDRCACLSFLLPLRLQVETGQKVPTPRLARLPMGTGNRSWWLYSKPIRIRNARLLLMPRPPADRSDPQIRSDQRRYVCMYKCMSCKYAGTAVG